VFLRFAHPKACRLRGHQFKKSIRPPSQMNLFVLMPLSTRKASNEVDWREAQIWLRGVAGMGLHRCICYGRDDPGFSDEVEI